MFVQTEWVTSFRGYVICSQDTNWLFKCHALHFTNEFISPSHASRHPNWSTSGTWFYLEVAILPWTTHGAASRRTEPTAAKYRLKVHSAPSQTSCLCLRILWNAHNLVQVYGQIRIQISSTVQDSSWRIVLINPIISIYRLGCATNSTSAGTCTQF